MPSRVRAFGALGASIEMSSSFRKHTHVEALQRTTEHRQSMSQLKLVAERCWAFQTSSIGGGNSSPQLQNQVPLVPHIMYMLLAHPVF